MEMKYFTVFTFMFYCQLNVGATQLLYCIALNKGPFQMYTWPQLQRKKLIGLIDGADDPGIDLEFLLFQVK